MRNYTKQLSFGFFPLPRFAHQPREDENRDLEIQNFKVHLSRRKISISSETPCTRKICCAKNRKKNPIYRNLDLPSIFPVPNTRQIPLSARYPANSASRASCFAIDYRVGGLHEIAHDPISRSERVERAPWK